MVGGEVCAIWKIFVLSTSSVGIHNSKNIFTSSSVGALQGAVCQSFFALKLMSSTELFYLGDWQTSYLGASARLILKEVEVTVQLHCLRIANSGRCLVQLREISDIGSSAPQFLTEGLDHFFP